MRKTKQPQPGRPHPQGTLNASIDDPILVTNDRILQIKAGIYNLTWEEYKDSDPFRSDSQMYTGFVDEDETPYVNSFRWENGTPVFYGSKENKAITYTHEVWGVKPRNIYQNLALELMLNNEINLVSIQSEAGYGKTFLALASALYLALEKKDNPFEKGLSGQTYLGDRSQNGFPARISGRKNAALCSLCT